MTKTTLRLLFLLTLLVTLRATSAESLGPVTREYFGLHIHRADQGTSWPTVPFGSWRLWDAYVGWAHLEPERDRWDFSRLDRYVAMAALTKVEILLPLAMTPPWASVRPTEASGYKNGNAAEPRDIADWSRYVRTVGQRYKGKIHHFEIWNEPSDKTHYTGSVEKLVELTCEANRILKSIDPEIKVVSPASAGGGKHIEYLDKFLSSGGKRCVDIIAHHFYVPRFGPEAMVPLIRQVKSVMRKNGVGALPLWNTETGWWIENRDGTPDNQMVAKGGWRKVAAGDEGGAFIFRAFLLARAEGVERFFWYSWDNSYGLGLVEPRLNELKPMTAYWNDVYGVLISKSVNGCVELSKVWSCRLSSKNEVPININWNQGDSLDSIEGFGGRRENGFDYRFKIN